MPLMLFISYSRTDAEVVARLRRALTALGAEIWIDHLRLTPGTPDWEDAIKVGIQKSQWVIYAASPDAMQSDYVKGELRYAQRFKKPIIPFWVAGEHWEDCVPLNMTMTQYIDSRPTLLDKTRLDQAVGQLVTTLGLDSPRATSSVARPYPTSPPVKEYGAAPGRGSTSLGGLTRRQVVVGGIATVATIAGLGIVLSRMGPGGNTGHDQATAPPRPPGQLLWKYKITGVLGAMAVDSKYLYVISADSNLHALDISTGKVAWTFITGLGSNSARQSGTVVSGGVVYFGVSDGGRSDFIALEIATRKPRWRLHFDDDNKRWTGTPAVVGGVAYFGDEQGFLYAVRVSDGSLLWRSDSPDPRTYIQSTYTNSPVIANGRVYVGRGDKVLRALNGATGHELWRFTADDIIMAPPTVADNAVYVASTDTTLTALDASSGSRYWSFGVGASAGNGAWSPPLAANGLVYVADIFNALYAVNAVSGDAVWHAEATFATGPVIANDTIYIGDGNGVRVSAYEARFGAQRWQFRTDVPNTDASPSQLDAQFTTPTVRNGVVYISSITNPSTNGYDASTIYAITA